MMERPASKSIGETTMRILFLTALFSSAFGAVVLAAKDQPTTKPATGKSDAPVNKMCPVEPDHDVDPKVTVTHAGKVVGFCCKDCIEEFEKNPKQYMEKVK